MRTKAREKRLSLRDYAELLDDDTLSTTTIVSERPKSHGLDTSLGQSEAELLAPEPDDSLSISVTEDDNSPVVAGGYAFSSETNEKELPRIIELLKNRIGLDDEQTNKLKRLFKKMIRRNSWIKQNFSDRPMARKRRLAQSLRLFDRQFNGVLTDEQRETYKAIKQQLNKDS